MNGWPRSGWARLKRMRSRRALRWAHLPRTVRLRLTAVYVALFVASTAGLLAIIYLTLDSNAPVRIQRSGAGGGPVLPRGVAGRSCPSPRAGPSPTKTQIGTCATFIKVAQHASDVSRLLAASWLALVVMTVVAVGIGWLVAGRVLRPLRTITATARRISASNLHQRLALSGPADELKELGDTVDGLLARLECSFDAQRQFVANASHELRTPLARQRTLVDVALADPEPTVAGLQDVCRRVLAAGEQQERLIEALLTLARSQRGLDRWDPLDMAVIGDEVVGARRAEAQRLGVSLGFSTGTAGAPAAALGDARLAERLAANLVDNALQHNVPGGWVSVWAGTSAGQAVLRVVNSGPLVPPGEVARLFAPFQRLGISRAGERRDSPGLGLSIVSAIAAAHGAELQVSALTTGGLDVQVRFPPTAGPGPAAGQARQPVPSPAALLAARE